jgi:L-asparaginase II
LTQKDDHRDTLIAQTVRDGIVDCEHYGSAVLVDADGSILWSKGNPNKLVFERSTTMLLLDREQLMRLEWMRLILP